MAMKILMVDDEATILLHYKMELQDEGYDVITAGDADEALRLFEEEKPDMVTLDVVMPMRAGGRLKPSLEPVGIQVLRQMKEINMDVPVIMLSAYDYKDRAEKLNCEGYLTKSADTESLRKMILEISSRMKKE
jgi:DNA-binding response OmpR family regulator